MCWSRQSWRPHATCGASSDGRGAVARPGWGLLHASPRDGGEACRRAAFRAGGRRDRSPIGCRMRSGDRHVDRDGARAVLAHGSARRGSFAGIVGPVVVTMNARQHVLEKNGMHRARGRRRHLTGASSAYAAIANRKVRAAAARRCAVHSCSVDGRSPSFRASSRATVLTAAHRDDGRPRRRPIAVLRPAKRRRDCMPPGPPHGRQNLGSPLW